MIEGSFRPTRVVHVLYIGDSRLTTPQRYAFFGILIFRRFP